MNVAVFYFDFILYILYMSGCKIIYEYEDIDKNNKYLVLFDKVCVDGPI